MPKRATIVDVAKLAGVSTMTVSRVTHNSSQVRESTRIRVKKAIATLNYQPEFSARALASRITGNLGLLVQHGNRNPEFYRDVANGIENELIKHNYSLMIQFSPFDAVHLPAMISQRKVDGVIVGGMKVDAELLKAFQNKSLPVVVIDNLLDVEGIHYIVADYQDGAEKAVHYLSALGHRNIAFIGMDNKYFCTVCKLAGYKKALKKAGHKVQKEFIFFAKSQDFRTKDFIRKIFQNKKVTAVFCTDDFIAFDLIKILGESSVSVPKDVSFIGFNDLSLATLSTPALTTVHVDKELIGSLAAKKLLENIWNPKITSSKTIIETKLIIRDSCQKWHESPATYEETKQFISGGDVALINS